MSKDDSAKPADTAFGYSALNSIWALNAGMQIGMTGINMTSGNTTSAVFHAAAAVACLGLGFAPTIGNMISSWYAPKDDPKNTL